MIYSISQPITTNVTYEVEAPDNLSQEQLWEFMAYIPLNVEFDGFDRDDIKGMYSEFMDTAIVEVDGEEIY